MIFPADSPREALMSNDGRSLRLKAEPVPSANGMRARDGSKASPQAREGEYVWRTGRAGMEYRDLFVDRIAGEVAVSHIRLNNGGPVPDYVHYHKIGFQ